MGEGSTNGRMVLYSKVISGWTKDRVKERCSTRMDHDLKGTGATISETKTQFSMSILNRK
jgi:hypothetical protein